MKENSGSKKLCLLAVALKKAPLINNELISEALTHVFYPNLKINILTLTHLDYADQSNPKAYCPRAEWFECVP